MDFPAPEPVVLHDELDVATLVSYLRRDARDRPVVVLTVPFSQNLPCVDGRDIAAAAPGKVDVVTIPNSYLTRYFASSIAPGAAVFGGACRVYPPGQDWESSPDTTPVRMARDPDQIQALPSRLLDDVKQALARKTPGGTPVAKNPGPQSQPVPTMAKTSAQSVATMIKPGPQPVPTAPPDPGAGVPENIATSADAQALAVYLRSPGRRHPAIVVSRAAGASEAYVDVETARSDLSGFADVFELTTLKASWALRDFLPSHCDVYGGASRVYPIGSAWQTDPGSSPLRFAHSMRERGAVTRTIISDAMKMASRGSYSTCEAAQRRTLVTGTVIGMAAGRGLVRLASGGNGVLWPELVEPSVSAERLFAPDMAVTGELDPETRCIDVLGMRRDPDDALNVYCVGDTILVRVQSVSADSCTVELYPGVTSVVSAQDVTETDVPDLRVLVSVDEVLPIYIVDHDANEKEWLLSLRDAAEAEDAVAAPAILIDGPPWLVPVVSQPVNDENAGDGAVFDERVFDTPDVVGVARSLYLENRQLADQLRQAEQDALSLRDQLAKAKAQGLAGIRNRSRKDREARAQDRLVSDQALFLDEREQLEFEIKLAWARMTQPTEKALYPLKRWSYSDQFFPTLRAVQGHGISREKIVEVIVYVLTGRDRELASCELHRLRTGPGGDDPPRTRKGGSETCWRVSLQQKSASARRLHYWACQDGSIELASVRLHDDFDT